MRGTAAGFVRSRIPAGDTPPVRPTPRAVVADFNGDGKDDLAEAEAIYDPLPAARLCLRLAGPDGVFGSPLTMTIPPATADIAAVDFDRDGKADLALTDAQDGGVKILRNTTAER